MTSSPNSQLPTPNSHILGIRHHGPGSARSVREALERLQPDIVLVEGPPDAADVLPLLAHADMHPPVALLIYAPDAPRNAVYYPFAVFSPEWQALHYALTNSIPARFMDLPQRHALALRAQQESANPTPNSQLPTPNDSAPDPQPLSPDPRRDPIGTLAAAAGYSDGERWWEHVIEQRNDSAGVFEAIGEAMSALRAHSTPDPDPIEAQREAWMRQSIRAAQRDGFARIAVVCGAWHGPALVDLADEAGDERLLRKLPKIDVRATWVPWTYNRLSYRSGYGAGIESPGWYEHLWRASDAAQSSTETAIRWMAKIARMLRNEDLDASSASVIEAVRLAETLAALRDRPLPGLPELSEAAQAVFCFNDDLPMRLIHDKLIVGHELGEVPPDTPLAPLQADLARLQKRLRLPAQADWKDYDLDLRKPNDLERSYLLHRLHLLDIPWGKLQGRGGKGTFHELWRLEWQPELAVALIEAGVWGSTLLDAATAFVHDTADRATQLPELTRLIDRALLADLPDAVAHLMARVEQQAAVSSDILHLMEALPPLANVLRYGNVRKTDTSAVAHVVDGMVARIAIGLPNAAIGLNDEAADALFKHLVATNNAIGLLQNAEQQTAWHAALGRVATLHNVHGLIAGRAVGLLLDADLLAANEAARLLNLALSTASDPVQAAAWIDGLLRDSAALLLHDTRLWAIIDGWVAAIPADAFTPVLPLLRRTFATWSPPERRSLGEHARRGATAAGPDALVDGAIVFDYAHAEAALETTLLLLGMR